jgi:hypothetical protein
VKALFAKAEGEKATERRPKAKGNRTQRGSAATEKDISPSARAGGAASRQLTVDSRQLGTGLGWATCCAAPEIVAAREETRG